MRDFTNLEMYLNSLLGDVYPQNPDPGHTERAQWVMDNWISMMSTCHSVLDVGCGQGFCKPMFDKLKIEWTGVTLGSDYVLCRDAGLNVVNDDMSFLRFPAKSFDLVFARHVLEHSPMPLLTLMEFRRVAVQWLCVVLPNPKEVSYHGQNHYSVMLHEQFLWLAERAGWHPIWQDIIDSEMRYMLEKAEENRT